jgi:hypothetical protein
VQKTGLDLDASIARLNASGIVVEGEKQTIQEIAARNQLRPKDVYQAMLPEAKSQTSGSLPLNPPPGLGRLTLAQLCAQYGLDDSAVMQALADEGLKGNPDMTLRDIGQQNQVSPMDVYMTIKGASDNGIAEDNN